MKDGISKSQYIMGKQCAKALWLHRHPPLTETFSVSAKAKGDSAKIENGHQIGAAAMQYFKGGVTVTEDYMDTEKAVQATQAFIDNGSEVIFEAAAINPTTNTYCHIDVLKRVPGTDEWDLIEVKASTSVKPYHRDDLAFQYHVFSGAGYKIRKTLMMIVDKDYVRQGDVDPAKLFKQVEITTDIKKRQAALVANLPGLQAIAAQSDEPVRAIGQHCSKPLDCGFKSKCWKDVPAFSVFNIFARGSSEPETVAAQTGSYKVEDVPDEMLPAVPLRQLEIDCHKTGNAHVDIAKLKNFANDLQYPLYYLDYETIAPGVPAYEGTSPYENIPFQFSLHIQEQPGGPLVHKSFLHKDRTDPRESFIKSLIDACGNKGSVIVYHQDFEATRNKELANAFPQYAAQLDAINARMADLLLPFKHRWMYHPAQNGSASIKAVLPAFTDLSYKGLDIGNGADASQLYQRFATGGMESLEDQAKLWTGLDAYCTLDTLAMVKLVRVIEDRVAALQVQPQPTAPNL